MIATDTTRKLHPVQHRRNASKSCQKLITILQILIEIHA
jgi:hypothetical protein